MLCSDTVLMPLADNALSARPGALDRLPQEVLELILVECDIVDIKNLRCTSRSLADAGVRLLFEHVKLCCMPFSIGKLKSIADSDKARHVKRITLYVNQLKYDVCKEEFFELMHRNLYDTEEARRSRRIRGPWRPDDSWPPIPEAMWPQAWRAYEKFSTEQNRMFECPLCRKVLREAFCALPALQELHITTLSSWEGVDPDEDIGPVWEPGSTSMALLKRMDFVVGCADAEYGADMQRVEAAVLPAMLDALGQRAVAQRQSGSHVLKLELYGVSYGPMLSQAIICVGQQSGYGKRMDAIMLALAHLEQVNFGFSTWQWEPAPLHATEIRTLFGSCSRLRALHINCSDYTPSLICPHGGCCPSPPTGPLERHCTLNALFRSSPTVWPRLEVLSLTESNAFSKDFLTFMHAQGHQIRRLTMVNCCFDDTKAILLAFPQCFTNLERLRIWQLWDVELFESCTVNEACFFPEGLDLRTTQWLLGHEGEVPDFSRYRPDVLFSPYLDNSSL